MSFHRKAVKLAGLYLAILLFISLCFSLNVYQLSTQEFESGIRRPGPMFDRPPDQGFPTQVRDELRSEREQQFETARQHVVTRLIIINLLILVGGGILSYYLALRTLKPIEAAHAALERFTADASHELRTPLTAMRSENEVALMDPKLTLPQAKQQLRSNIEELEKLTSLSEGLLRLASLDNTDLPLAELRPADLIAQAVARVQPLAEPKHITIHAQTNTDATLLGDADSLVEALVILLDNAVKYSPDHGQVDLAVVQDHKHLSFTVTDHGPGIAPADLPRVFDRFYRADAARSKRDAAGYGLGLPIARTIAARHHATLTATSLPASGATFTLTLNTLS